MWCAPSHGHVCSPPNWISIFWLHDMPDMFLCSLACFQLNPTVLISCACWCEACNHVFSHESWMLSVSSLCLRWFPSCSGNAGVRAEVRAELQQAALHRAPGQGEDALQTRTQSSSVFYFLWYQGQPETDQLILASVYFINLHIRNERHVEGGVSQDFKEKSASGPSRKNHFV